MTTTGYRYNGSDVGYGGWPSEESYLSVIKQMTIDRPNARYLDIGSGLGRIIDIVKHNVTSVVGLEPDPERYQACRNGHHGDKRIQLFNETIQAYRKRNPGDRFDIVAVSMVVQHVARATCHQLLCDARDLLKPDGRAIIATTQAPEEWFGCDRDNTPKTGEDFDRYAMDIANQRHGIPVRHFSRATFCQAITDAELVADLWDQFSFVPPEKRSGLPNSCGFHQKFCAIWVSAST